MEMRKCKTCGKSFAVYSSRGQKYCSKSCGKLTSWSLCWDCNNYCCNWIAEAQPVEGWEAVSRVYMIRNGEKVISYRVKSCPEFIGRSGKNDK